MWDATNCTNNEGLPWDMSNLFFNLCIYVRSYISLYIYTQGQVCMCHGMWHVTTSSVSLSFHLVWGRGSCSSPLCFQDNWPMDFWGSPFSFRLVVRVLNYNTHCLTLLYLGRVYSNSDPQSCRVNRLALSYFLSSECVYFNEFEKKSIQE